VVVSKLEQDSVFTQVISDIRSVCPHVHYEHGDFWFLSKAHIEQSGDLNVIENQIELIQIQIDRQQKDIARNQGALDMLDDALAKYTELGAVTKGLQAREQQKPERDALNLAISTSGEEIARLQEEQAKLQLEVKAFEVEVGPIRYVADLLFADADLERAVRWVIITIIFVFDPLAILLVIAANMTIRDEFEKRKPKSNPYQNLNPIQTMMLKQKNGSVQSMQMMILNLK
jgi:hypothetical protein